jgi:hypothetical protein
MARKRVEIHEGEAVVISGLLSERDSINKSLMTAMQMICARNGIDAAVLQSVEENAVIIDVPDNSGLKLDRTGASRGPDTLFDDQSAGNDPETPSNGQHAPALDGLRRIPGLE